MKTINLQTKFNTTILFWGILLLALALRVSPLPGLTRGALNYSEGSMMRDASWSFWRIIEEISPDQAPLKYYILHGMLYLGRTELLLGLPSLVFDLLSIALLFFLGKLLFDKKTALLACFFMAISMWNIHHATLVRNYPLYTFAFLASTFFLCRAIQRRRFFEWILYAAATAVSFYAFYPAFFILISQILWFFIFYGSRRDLAKGFLFSAGFGALMMCPLLPYAAAAFSYRMDFGNGVWGLQNFWEIAGSLTSHLSGIKGIFPSGILIFIASLLTLIISSGKRREAWLLSFLVTVPLVFYVVCFYLFRICLVPRLFFPVYPFFLLTVAAGIMSWKHWGTRLAVASVFLLPLCLYAMSLAGYKTNQLLPADYKREPANFSAVASIIERYCNASDLDYVAVTPWPALFFIQYYLDKPNKFPVIERIKNSSGRRYSSYTNLKITLFGVDNDLSLLKELAANGRLLVVDVVSGNMASLPDGPETLAWLQSGAERVLHEAGADFYFMSFAARFREDGASSSRVAKQKLYLGSHIVKRSNFTGKIAMEN